MNLKNYLEQNFKNQVLQFNGLNFKVLTNFNECEGKLIYIFHYGLLCTFDHFRYQIKFLHEMGAPILLMNYRGHESLNSHIPIEQITFSNIISDFSSAIEYFKPGKISLIAHSMGVNISLELALRKPQIIEKMVLISGTIFPPQNVMFDSNIINFIQPIAERLYQIFPDQINYFWSKQKNLDLVKFFIHLNGFNYEKTSREFIDVYIGNLSEYPPRLFFHLLTQMKEHSIISELHNICAPSLIISGDRDKVIPIHMQHALNDILPKSTLYVLQKGSHVPQIDFPDLVNTRIAHFIDHKPMPFSCVD